MGVGSVQVEAEGHGQRRVQQRHQRVQLLLAVDRMGLALPTDRGVSVRAQSRASRTTKQEEHATRYSRKLCLKTSSVGLGVVVALAAIAQRVVMRMVPTCT